jgi:hypothetical protein
MSLRARTSSPSGARQRDLVESIILLAGLSQLVIVDITDPRFTPMELHAIVPNFAVQVVPIMKRGTEPFWGLLGVLRFPWGAGRPSSTRIRGSSLASSTSCSLLPIGATQSAAPDPARSLRSRSTVNRACESVTSRRCRTFGSDESPSVGTALLNCSVARSAFLAGGV